LQDRGAVGMTPSHGHRRIQLAKHFIEPRGAAQRCGLASEHLSARVGAGADQSAGDVSGADILGERARDELDDIGRQLAALYMKKPP
jgi:hypothetical protein